MLLSVRHETTYTYDAPAFQVAQVLRMTPSPYDALQVLSWRVARSDGAALPEFVDGLGNVCCFSSMRGPVDGVSILVEGRVRLTDTEGVVSGASERLPPAYFKRVTPLTTPSGAIAAFAREVVPGENPPDRFALYDLMAAVHQRVAYTPGATDIGTTAEAAFEAEHGVCQDQAHILIAAARALGAPARYVGGYVWRGADESDDTFASHAWTEVWAEGTGWVGFDPSNGVWATTAHVRVAVGLDYTQAAPITGLWRGAATETMQVDGHIQATESSQ